MRLYAEMKKSLGSFSLDLCLQSDARRIGILGASGSGKSMTLRSIAGIEDLSDGHIEVDGRVLYDASSHVNLRPQQRRVGYMFQSYALFPSMTVLENVMAGLKGAGKERRERARQMLARFRMEELAGHMPSQLSGGQRQRVALARIMVTRPALILLDEPFSALDGYLRDQMQLELLKMLEEYSGQTVMVSHNRDELYRFSEEIFVISQGRLLRSGSTREVFRDPQLKEAAILTGCKSYFAARPLDRHTLLLPSWNVCLHLDREIPPHVSWLGYRAHDFRPIWGKKEENCIPFLLDRTDDLPFERHYYLLSPGEEEGKARTAIFSGKEELGRESPLSGREEELKRESPLSGREEELKRESSLSGREEELKRESSLSGREEELKRDSSLPRGLAGMTDQFREGICWIVQEDMCRQIQRKGLPDYLQLTQEAMMLLR